MASSNSTCVPAKLDLLSPPDPEALLDKLEELLKNCTTKEANEVENPSAGAGSGDYYTKCLSELKKATAAHIEKLAEVMTNKACEHIRSTMKDCLSDATFTYSMLSIGCGDGSFDARIIQAIAEQFPSIKIHYIGTDIDKDTCQKAEEVLRALPNVKIEVETLVFDFNDVDDFKDRIPPCDLAMASHVLYYMRDMKKSLLDAKSLKKENGNMLILHTTSQSPRAQLISRFWMHKNSWPVKLLDKVVEALNELGIHYESQLIEGELDLTEHFRDGFKKPHQRFLLGFMMHTKLQCYPEEISQVCIDYLESVAVGKPERYTIHFSAACIVY